MKSWLDSKLFLIVFLFLLGCNDRESEVQPNYEFNMVECQADKDDNEPYLAFKVQMEESKAVPFIDSMIATYGIPQTWFLHFTLQDFNEFFDPSKRAFGPEILVSPYGAQKIMVWDSIESDDQLIQVSMQVEQKKKVNVPVCPDHTEFEFRFRKVSGENLMNDCNAELDIIDAITARVLKHFGDPEESNNDIEFTDAMLEYQNRLKRYGQRVDQLLDVECYPPVTWRPGWNVFRLNLCEAEWVQDTIVGKVEVWGQGKVIPFLLYDSVLDRVSSEIKIFPGHLDYWLYAENLKDISYIYLKFEDSKLDLTLFDRDEDDFESYPPFRPKYDKDFILKKSGKLNINPVLSL